MTVQCEGASFSAPAVDTRVVVTDLYVFQNPGDASRTVLIMSVNPLAPRHADEFRHDAVYEMLIDTDCDARPDVSLRCRFTPKISDRQFARVTRALLTKDLEDGHIHEELETETLVDTAAVSFGLAPIVADGAGEVRFFAGLRSDPCFFDLQSYVSGMRFHPPGADFFADKNVFGIALELPNRLLGENPRIGVWARTLVPMVYQCDHLTQFDQVGRPLVNSLFNHGNDQKIFNRILPTDQSATLTASGQTFLQSFTSKLMEIGNYAADEAREVAQTVLPDILTFDYSRPTLFPNGRRLQDDTADFMLRLLTNEAKATDYVRPHGDYLAEFPYLGAPHELPVQGRANGD